MDRIRTLAVGPEGGAPNWKITRNEEWGQWKFAAGGERLHPSAAVMAVNKLGQLSFNDVAADPEAEAADKPVVVVAETFDNLVYTLKLTKTAKGDDYSRHLHGDGRAAEEPHARRRARSRRTRNAATRNSPRPASGSRIASPSRMCSASGPTSLPGASSSRC